MALEPTPFLVGGGASHSAAVARTVAYAATGGKSGIAERADLRVATLAVPGTSVRVLPGVATIVNSYAGGAGQSYVARNLSMTNVAIGATGSASGRSDLIVLSILDPEYEGSAPADPNAFNYTRLEVISGVSSTQRDLTGLNFPRPAIPLARIDIPKSTGTITSGMIKDLRKLANPRTYPKLFTHSLTSGEQDSLDYSVAGTTDGEQWPNIAWQVEIPDWATGVRLRGFFGQVRLAGSGSNNLGKLWVRVGSMADGFSSQSVNWDAPTSGGVQRQVYMVADDRTVPEEFRGTTRNIYLRGSVSNNNSNVPRLDSVSSISLECVFYEEPI